MEQPPQIAIFPTPGMGHLIPLGELAKLLVLRHGFSVTFLIPPSGNGDLPAAQRSLLTALPAGVRHVVLPPVSFSDLPDDTRAETLISLTVTRSLPSLREAFGSLVASFPVAVLMVDLFGTDAFAVAEEFNIPSYIFYPSTAMALSLFLHLPELDRSVSGEYRHQPDPIQIPGCIPIHGRDLLDPVQDRNNEAYKWVLHHAKRHRLAEGIMVNSFKELESGPITALQKEEPGKPPVYPIGPLIQFGSQDDGSGSECLRWLDKQPRGSVLFVSFGSGGTLTSTQLTELALGLELSEQRFLWVVRSPSDKSANATYFSLHSENDPLTFLPGGFVERTREMGLAVPSWAPQAAILRHNATGGFLSHCGWNSTLESVVSGVPMIAWPLYAEQKMNAVMLAEDLKVALRPRAAENLIGRSEIAGVVKGLMKGEEGKLLRARMNDLKEAAEKAISEDGNSTKSLSELAEKWKSKIKH